MSAIHDLLPYDAAESKPHRPDRRQTSLMWLFDDAERRKPAARRYDTDDHRAAEAYLTPERVAFARRVAAWASRQGWGDEHELLSAGLGGLLAVSLSPQVKAGVPRDADAYFRGAVWTQMRRVRARSRREAGSRRRPYAIAPEILAAVVPDQDSEKDFGRRRIDPDEFWSVVGATVTPKQSRLLELLYRDDVERQDARQQMKLSGNAACRHLRLSRHRLRHRLGKYLEPAFPDAASA